MIYIKIIFFLSSEHHAFVLCLYAMIVINIEAANLCHIFGFDGYLFKVKVSVLVLV